MIINECSIDRISMGTSLTKLLKSCFTVGQIPDLGSLRPSVWDLIDFDGFPSFFMQISLFFRCRALENMFLAQGVTLERFMIT